MNVNIVCVYDRNVRNTEEQISGFVPYRSNTTGCVSIYVLHFNNQHFHSLRGSL